MVLMGIIQTLDYAHFSLRYCASEFDILLSAAQPIEVVLRHASADIERSKMLSSGPISTYGLAPCPGLPRAFVVIFTKPRDMTTTSNWSALNKMATSITRALLAVSSRRVLFRPRTLTSAADKTQTDAVVKKDKTNEAVETVPADTLVRK